MQITGPEVISQLKEKLQFSVGRHLYAVLGSYAQLEQFERDALAQARDPQNRRLPEPINLSRRLLASIGDDDLRGLVGVESRRPQTVQRHLVQALNRLLADLQQEQYFLILKHFELIFAYRLDFGVFRTRAANQNHMLLLLPGERRGDHLILYHEADAKFHRSIPSGILADNHLWELSDG